ncbi:hypothetical protein C8A01DRAFT_45253 [Parachaetomium inaequale]|uniref:G domain-containing protein n=1 Tax=Parachaetomium inaequale TaxID=2588326 RepID=A0AAN6STN2_9PEZI|nr:hypothetical protein C8A01DRAFT_45253 [Parachaetomium inaequale]
MSSNGTLNRPALGQDAQLGALYDARTDKFLDRSLFKNGAPSFDAIHVTKNKSTDLNTVKAATFTERCDQLDVNAELGASILAGLVKLGGSALCLSLHKFNTVDRILFRYTVTTMEEKIKLDAGNIKESLAFSALDTDIATHVVVGVHWGSNYVVCSERLENTASQPQQIRPNGQVDLEGVIRRLRHLQTPSENDGAEDMVTTPEEQHGAGSPGVLIFGDVLPGAARTHAVATRLSIERFVRRVDQLISDTHEGKGRQIMYTLMPLPLLAYLRLLEVKIDLTVPQTTPECLQRLFQHFDDTHTGRETLRRYVSLCRQHPSVVSSDHVRGIETQLQESMARDGALQLTLAATLKAVRSGKAKADQVGHILSDIQAKGPLPATMSSMASLTGKIDFVKKIVREGSEYVGFQKPSLKVLLARNQHEDAYTTVIAVDCDAIGQRIEKPYICHFRRGQMFIEDLLEHRKVLAENCTMRYIADALDASLTSKPLGRRAVRIPCPHSLCDGSLPCDGICAVCKSPVEYGVVDDRLYCDCGATRFDNWSFKCNDPAHSEGWVGSDDEPLLAQLNALEPFEELNILVLGETGVGKSTWINAFVNYLTYESLRDAIQAEDLKCLIPCSFSTQLKDPSDPQGRFVQKDIKIGRGQHEHDGSRGQSATQRTSVYAIDVGWTRVRLIDTPGIGDTKGLEQDNRNMADILRVLRTYDKLHGILILLKPNASRLTVMFRFCVKQLLTQLHKNAASNIVFGFTNTRGSNYKPGDTFKPLEELLTGYKQVKMGLFEHNVYCFDSESFRYLAARQKGIDMGLLEDNMRSWEYSVSESKRLLKHIKSLAPHQVRSTINLNETRDMIVKLTEPITLIAQKIQTSIAVNDDQIKKLRSTQLSRDELEKSLYVQRETVESYDVGEPRTVCTHGDCVEVRNDFAGRDEAVIVYKTMCHKPCYLGDHVKRNQKGDPQLWYCAAMDGSGFCIECGHNYLDHMHIYYDYRPITYRHENQDVSRELIKNASDIELQQQAIELRKTAIEEFKLEHNQVQEAAIQFGFFLRRHAIEPYNDATVEYVDYLIHQEKMKVKSGGKKQTLKMLEKYKEQHLQKVQALTKAMERGDHDIVLDDQGVRQLVDSLYGLPHFGDDLKRIVRTNEKAAEATFREKSCRPPAAGHEQTSAAAHSAEVAHAQMMPPLNPDPNQMAIINPMAAMQHHHQPQVPWLYVWFPAARERIRGFWRFRN